MERTTKYSQFNLMTHYLWYHKRDEYSWHLEAVNATDSRMRELDGATEDMMRPRQRCSLHFNYDDRENEVAKSGGQAAVEHFTHELLLRGFCYSLTKEEYENDEKGLNCTKAGYSWQNVSTTPDLDQWAFGHLDWQWDPRTVEAHKERHALNKKKPD